LGEPVSNENKALLLAYLDLLDGPVGPDPGAPPLSHVLRSPPAWTLESPPVDAMPFSSRYRQAGQMGALELSRAADQVTAFDPDATHLTLMAVGTEGRAWGLGQVATALRGVTITAPIGDRAQVRVVAIATLGPVDVGLCGLWLERLHIAGEPPASSDEAHVATLDVERRPAEELLELREEPLPKTRPANQSLLALAAASGRAGRFQDAFEAYGQVLKSSAGDPLARVKARVGQASFLYTMGFGDDARRALEDIAKSEALDRPMGALVARKLAFQALHRLDTDAAEPWVREALRLEPDSAFGRILSAQLLVHRGAWEDALEAIASLPDPIRSREPMATAFAAQTALCRVSLGQVSDGLALLPSLEALGDLRLETKLWCLLAWATAQGRRRTQPWDTAVDIVAGAMRDAQGRELDAACRQLLVVLAVRAHADGAPGVASKFLSLRFGLHDSTRGLRVAMSPRGLLVANARGDTALRPISHAELDALRASVRHEWTGDELGPCHAAVRALLNLQGKSATEVIACDGSLAGMPVQHIVAPGTPVLRVHDLAHPPRARLGNGVVSIADSLGDLPGARSEVPRGPGVRRFVGSAATFAALGTLGDVGLLHIGVHANRQAGVATLRLADCAATPDMIASLELHGGPVVLLGGCGTAPRAGAERAFAQAFRQAGASAVIATHWPMRDGELVLFVRRLLARWPFQSPARAVASVARELRAEGQPRRVWGAAVVL
jgi:tetratricopeptide (TPR) repeat protein